MSVSELKFHCVDRFSASESRINLFLELEKLFHYLSSTGLICSAWINGSFVTEKQDPEDIDLCVAFISDDFNLLDDSHAEFIMEKLNGGKIFSDFLDIYLCPLFYRSDPRRGADASDYWSAWWGVGRDNWLKGFVVIGIGETDVQRRLAAR